MELFTWIICLLVLAFVLGPIVYVRDRGLRATATPAALRSAFGRINRVTHDRFGKVITPFGGAHEIARRRSQLERGILKGGR